MENFNLLIIKMDKGTQKEKVTVLIKMLSNIDVLKKYKDR